MMAANLKKIFFYLLFLVYSAKRKRKAITEIEVTIKITDELQENAQKSVDILYYFIQNSFFPIIQAIFIEREENFDKSSCEKSNKESAGVFNELFIDREENFDKSSCEKSDKESAGVFNNLNDQLKKLADEFFKLKKYISKIKKIFKQKKEIIIGSDRKTDDQIYEIVVPIFEQLESLEKLQGLSDSWLETEILKFNEFIGKNNRFHESLKNKIKSQVNCSADVSDEEMKDRYENVPLSLFYPSFDENDKKYIFELHHFRRIFYLLSQIYIAEFSNDDKVFFQDNKSLYINLCKQIAPVAFSPYFPQETIGDFFMAFDLYSINLILFQKLFIFFKSQFHEFFKNNKLNLEKYAGKFMPFYQKRKRRKL